MPQAVKCRADIQVSCFTHEGIDAVKAALMKGLENDKEDMPIKVMVEGDWHSGRASYERQRVPYQFLTKSLSWKRREVCSLLQAAETLNLPLLIVMKVTAR